VTPFNVTDRPTDKQTDRQTDRPTDLQTDGFCSEYMNCSAGWPAELKIDDTEIIRENSTKFLAVMINQSLTCNDHISIVKQKVSKGIGIIKRIA